MLIVSLEKPFGHVKAIPETHTVEFLWDNGGVYIAAETGKIARQMGLNSVNTQVCKSAKQRDGRKFLQHIQRDYVSRIDRCDAKTVTGQLSAAFKHFDEMHSNSFLKMQSPRELR